MDLSDAFACRCLFSGIPDMPMYGITIAFKDYNIFKVIFDSPGSDLEF